MLIWQKIGCKNTNVISQCTYYNEYKQIVKRITINYN